MQGLSIQTNSNNFFANGSNPGGMLTAPGTITDEAAKRLKDYWDTAFSGTGAGKVAVAGDGLKYEQFTVNAVDAQLIEQLKWTAENVCTCYHVPAYMIGVGPPPPYANVEPLVQQYYSQCLQSLILNIETSLDEGLGLGPQFGNSYGTEFDPDDLIWLDTATKAAAAKNGIGGPLAPNEARKKYYGIGPVKGGEVPILQQQYWPIDQLAERSAPAIPAQIGAPPQADDEPDEVEDDDDDELEAASFSRLLHQKALEAGLVEA
jgi:HK97 family phage portal protein